MKPHFHKVPTTNSSSFSFRHDIKSNFGTLWHFHPELELHYIVKGQGVQYIGDTVSGFSDGDLILLGENLPHTWRCSDHYFLGKRNLKVEAYVLQFLPHCMGKDFIKLPETKLVESLFEKSKKGLKITGSTKKEIAYLLEAMKETQSFERVILFLKILHILSTSDEYETISPGYAYSHLTNISEMKRLEKIYTYVMAHYKEEISLEKIAFISNLTVSSFCRYFKKMTNKTFFEFLIEVRISNACKAIIEDKLPIEVICYECGFRNISNFYRHFKKVTKMTPFKYQLNYLQTFQKPFK